MIADVLLFVYLSLESTTTKTTPIPIPNPERPIHHDHTALRHDDELNALLRWFSFIIHHQGGGIYVYSGSAVCYGCTFSGNSASSSGDDVHISGGSFSTPTDCNAGWSGSGYTGGSVIDSNSGTYYSYSSGCTICAAGTFKASTGSAPCMDCDAGKHSSATGATSNATALRNGVRPQDH